jgi:hypothetical protein
MNIHEKIQKFDLEKEKKERILNRQKFDLLCSFWHIGTNNYEASS